MGAFIPAAPFRQSRPGHRANRQRVQALLTDKHYPWGVYASTGQAWHELMQEARADDCVVHVETTLAGRFIVGMSIVNGECEEVPLSGNKYYQIPLRDLERTEVSLDGFIEKNRHRLRRVIDETIRPSSRFVGITWIQSPWPKPTLLRHRPASCA